MQQLRPVMSTMNLSIRTGDAISSRATKGKVIPDGK